MTTHFDHLRADDGEHVGYIEMADDLFLPYDRLWNRRREPTDLDAAEELLDRIGLSLLARDWDLLPGDGTSRPTRVRVVEITRDSVTVVPTMDDTSGTVARALDLTERIALPLPTDRLREL